MILLYDIRLLSHYYQKNVNNVNNVNNVKFKKFCFWFEDISTFDDIIQVCKINDSKEYKIITNWIDNIK